MLTRRPAPRPWDVIALEVLLTLASAVQVGLLLWLALATWDDRGASGAVIGVLVVVALAVGAGWFLWLTGSTGWVLAGASGAAGLEVAFLLVMSISGELVGVSTSALLISLGAAILGVVCGIFLPAPSSRRYRPAPRERAVAGGPPSAPRVSPGVAGAADRYAKPVVAGAAAITAAGARKVSRSGAATTPTADVLDDESEPVLQPRAGTPIRTSGPTHPDDTPGTGSAAVAATPARGTSTPVRGTATPATGTAVPAAKTASRGAATTSGRSTPAASSPSTATPGGGTPASGTPRTSSRSGAPLPDPGAIARQARASIDAELAKPSGTSRPPASSTPGFRAVEPAPPATSVKRSPEPIRFSTTSGRTAPPRPPRGRPVGRAGDVQQPGDPLGVAPVIRTVPPSSPAPSSRPAPMPPPYDVDDLLPDPGHEAGPYDPPGAPR